MTFCCIGGCWQFLTKCLHLFHREGSIFGLFCIRGSNSGHFLYEGGQILALLLLLLFKSEKQCIGGSLNT